MVDHAGPASGAAVMGTGIVSIALYLDGQRALSWVLLVLAVGSWVALAGLMVARGRRDLRRWRLDCRRPAALSAVAATGVLGTRLALAGSATLGAAALVLALAIWLWLCPQVLAHWRRPTTGASFMLTVATQSLGLLAATLAPLEGARWLVYAALGPLGLGLLLYILALVSFDWHELGTGRGDQWVTGGALAISTVTAANVALAIERTGALAAARGPLRTLALLLWCLTMCWLPVLLVQEALHPRTGYDVRRWATVFPFGMYAVASLVVGPLRESGAITDFARVWVWVALALWTAVSAGMLRRAGRLGEPAERAAPKTAR